MNAWKPKQRQERSHMTLEQTILMAEIPAFAYRSTVREAIDAFQGP